MPHKTAYEEHLLDFTDTA